MHVLSSEVHFGTVSGIAVSAAGAVLVADQLALKLYSLAHHLPETDHNGDYMVSCPDASLPHIYSAFLSCEGKHHIQCTAILLCSRFTGRGLAISVT